MLKRTYKFIKAELLAVFCFLPCSSDLNPVHFVLRKALQQNRIVKRLGSPKACFVALLGLISQDAIKGARTRLVTEKRTWWLLQTVECWICLLFISLFHQICARSSSLCDRSVIDIFNRLASIRGRLRFVHCQPAARSEWPAVATGVSNAYRVSFL